MVSWLFAVKAFLQYALDEVLESVAVLNGMNLEAAVEIGGDLEGGGGRGRWGDCCHGITGREEVWMKLAYWIGDQRRKPCICDPHFGDCARSWHNNSAPHQ